MNGRMVVLLLGSLVNLVGCSGGNEGAGTPGAGGSQAAAGSGGGPGSGGASGNPGTAADACDFPAACGGSVVGTWKSGRLCATQVGSYMEMPFTCAAVVRNTTAGTVLTFNADSTYAVSEATVMSSIVQTTPVRCFPGTLSCATLNQDLLLSMQTHPELTSASCATSGINCVCTFEQTLQVHAESGTYAASGTTLTHTESGGSPITDSYCVQGNELHLLLRDSVGEVVYTKQ